MRTKQIIGNFEGFFEGTKKIVLHGDLTPYLTMTKTNSAATVPPQIGTLVRQQFLSIICTYIDEGVVRGFS
jgi:hypothetical protein